MSSGVPSVIEAGFIVCPDCRTWLSVLCCPAYGRGRSHLACPLCCFRKGFYMFGHLHTSGQDLSHANSTSYACTEFCAVDWCSHFSFVWKMCLWKCRCVQHSEPALLVGDTGTGKTTVCQMVALMRGQKLHIINCNQHTETSDFLGGFRPVRSVV